MPLRILVHDAPRPPGGKQRQVTHRDPASKLKVSGGQRAERRDDRGSPEGTTRPSTGFFDLKSQEESFLSLFQNWKKPSKGCQNSHGGFISSILLPFPVLADRSCAEWYHRWAWTRLWLGSAGSAPRAVGHSRFLQLWSSFIVFSEVLMWWKLLSKWTTWRFDVAALWGTSSNIFHRFACLLPTQSCQHPQTFAAKLLISSFSIIVQVRSPDELCVGSAGRAYTESAWRISESRGWSFAGSAQQTLWSPSHMSAETQKNDTCIHSRWIQCTQMHVICAWMDLQLTALVMDEVLDAWLRSHTFHTVCVGGDWTFSGVVRQAPRAQRVSAEHKENRYVTTASLLAYAAWKGTRTQLLFSWGRLLWLRLRADAGTAWILLLLIYYA